MRKIEAALVIGVLIVTGIKLIFSIRINLIVVLFFLALMLFYLMISFAFFNSIKFSEVLVRKSYQGISLNRFIGAIGLGFAIAFVVLGVLFKLQTWQGSDIYLSFGVFLLSIISMRIIIRYTHDSSARYKMILWRIGIYGVIAMIFLMIPKLTFFEITYRKHPSYVEAMRKLIDNPEDEELMERVQQERDKIFLID